MIRFCYLCAEDLEKPEVRKMADQGRVVLLMEDESIENKATVNRVMKYISPLQSCLRPAMCLEHVRVYIDYLVNREEEYFMSRYSREDRRDKFLCYLIGALLEHQLLMGSPGELAKRISHLHIATESRRRYIAEGRSCIELQQFMSDCDEYHKLSRLHLQR